MTVTRLDFFRRVPEQFSSGGDRHNAQKAWLNGFDAAVIALEHIKNTCSRCGERHHYSVCCSSNDGR